MKVEEYTTTGIEVPALVIKTITIAKGDDCRGCYYSMDDNTECTMDAHCNLKLDTDNCIAEIYVPSIKAVLKKL